MCRAPSALTTNFEEEDRPGDGGVEAGDLASHGDAHVEVDPAPDRRGEALPLASDDEAERSPQVGAAVVVRRFGLCADNANAARIMRESGMAQL